MRQLAPLNSTTVLRSLLKDHAEHLRVRTPEHDGPDWHVLGVTHDKDGPTLVVGPDPRMVDQDALF